MSKSGKRTTVRRGLKKRLSDSKGMLGLSSVDRDMAQIYGYTIDEKRESQFEVNMITDIEQINFLLWCLDNKGTIDSRRKLITEKK